MEGPRQQRHTGKQHRALGWVRINGVREDGRRELPSAIHKSGGRTGWQHPAGLPGLSTPLEEGLESKFSSIYYFFPFFSFCYQDQKKKTNPKKQKTKPKKQGVKPGLVLGDKRRGWRGAGGAADRQGTGASHYIHKELTGVAHGHSEGLSTGCQFGGHRGQVTAWRRPRGPHG